MRVALIGASGNVGSRILEELLRRGHDVIALVRHPERLALRTRLTTMAADANVPESLAPLLHGVDAVVSAVRFKDSNPARLIRAVRLSGVRRYVVVGGAGSLEIAPGQLEMDSPDFPPAAAGEAAAGARFLDALRGCDDLEWSFLSPSRVFTAGERSGKFRLGAEQMLVAADGRSSISFEDFAIALVDELEQPRHLRARFTVGY